MDFERMLAYTGALRAHNERSWFHENHRWYEEARSDFYALLDRLRYPIAEAAPEIGESILYMEARSWMFRIARDARLYRDRPPYDPSFRAYIAADRMSWRPIGYFLAVAPGETVFGTGMWLERTAEINRVRDHIASHLDVWEELLERGQLTLQGDRLKTMPRGYQADDPAAAWLRYKNWMVEFHFPDESLTDFDAFAEAVQALLPRMEPFRRFLLQASAGVGPER